jgi:hypothetical protein
MTTEVLDEQSARITALTFLVELLLAEIMREWSPAKRAQYLKNIDVGFGKITVPKSSGSRAAGRISDVIRARGFVASILQKASDLIDAPTPSGVGELIKQIEAGLPEKGGDPDAPAARPNANLGVDPHPAASEPAVAQVHTFKGGAARAGVSRRG